MRETKEIGEYLIFLVQATDQIPYTHPNILVKQQN